MSQPSKALSVWNTLSGKKEAFKPAHEPRVTIYCCGPTVYGYTHVGNARAALTLDLLARTFTYFGYQPEIARNYTDVDDKIIAAASKENISPEELSRKYEQAYASELKMLQTLWPQHTPRATEYIPSMIQMTEKLIKMGFAYPKAGDVYFRVAAFKEYGKLSHRDVEDMLAGVRIEADEEKESAADFALWKSAKPGEPSWPSPWGAGRPGWHIECSAMIESIFKSTIDIHMGGIDLIFPHHENEIAQSEACHQRPLAKYWVHNGLLEIGNEKMSKSLGNVVTTHAFLERYSPEVFRLLVLSVHYRSPIDFSPENIHRTELLLKKIYQSAIEASSAEEETLPSALPAELLQLRQRLEDALADDFHSAKAIGLLMSASRVCFRENRPSLWRAWREALPILREVFGLVQGDPKTLMEDLHQRKLRRTGISPQRAREIESLLEERTRVRQAKDFARADQIRTDLEKEGILVMDTSDGSTWGVRES